MKQFLNDFKSFIARGNVLDMAIGVIIGGAFAKIVSSLVDNIITPIISLFLKSVTFSDIKLTLGNWENSPTLNIGLFLQTVIDFLITALIIFIFIRQFQKVTKRFKKEEVQEVTTKECPYCLSIIPIGATRCAHCTSVLEDDKK